MPPVLDLPPDPDARAPQHQPPLIGDADLENLGAENVEEEEDDFAEVEDSDDEMTEKAPSQLPIDKFVSGTDDIDDWIERFETAVKLATNAQTDQRRNELYLQWLPLWIDEPARAVLRQIPTGTAYQTVNNVKGVKALLKELLLDPNDAYQWRAMKKKVTWDGKEDFQVLATRVIRAVDKYEKDLDQNARNNSYFFRFREALPKVYKDSIDVSLNKDERTIENAKELATRVRGTQPDHAVSFEAAAMVDSSVADNRIHGLELQVTELGTKIDNLNIKGDGDRGKDREPSRNRDSGRSGSNERYRRDSRDRGGYGGRRDSRDRGGYGRRDSRDRGGYDRRDSRDRDRGRYGGRDDRGYRRDYSRDYRRDNSYNRRDSSYNRRRDDGRDRNRRNDDRDRRNYNDRRPSPSPSGGRDQSRGRGSRDRDYRGTDKGRNSGNDRNDRNNDRRDGGNRGHRVVKDVSGDRGNYRGNRVEDESSDEDIDNAILAACAETLKKKPSGRSKRSGRQGND